MYIAGRIINIIRRVDGSVISRKLNQVTDRVEQVNRRRGEFRLDIEIYTKL